LIVAENASLQYLDHGKVIHACRDVNLHVEIGEFLGILGPSGSGKSSLLYLLCGLKQPTSGEVKIYGKQLQMYSRRERDQIRLQTFGFVFQIPYLLGYLSALENVLISRRDDCGEKEAWSLLEELGLADKCHRLPHEMSVGEKQRVCVARALLGGPKVVFADEPTASLDHENGFQVVELLRTHRKKGALVMVTHDPSMLRSADRVIRLEDGQVQDFLETSKLITNS